MAVASFHARSGGWVDLSENKHVDAVQGLIGAVRPTERDEMTLVQLLLEPTWMTTDDGKQPAFWIEGRVIASARSYAWASQLVRRATAAFGPFASFNSITFSPVRKPSQAERRDIVMRRWTRKLLPVVLPLTPRQVSRLFHPPERPLSTPHLYRSVCAKPPSSGATPAVIWGSGRSARGAHCDVGGSSDDLLRHALVVGPSGTGKTTFLESLARQLMEQGHGVTVLDPHGSLARGVARTMPRDRIRDAALVRVADREYPLAMNPLRTRTAGDGTVDEFVEVLQRVYGREYWGPLIDLVLRYAATAAIELRGTVIEAARLLDDPDFRERALDRIENPEAARALSQMGDGLDRRVLPAVNRLQRMLASPLIRSMLGQPECRLDFSEVFDQGRCLLFDLSGIGSINARLVGSLLLILIRQSALARETAAATSRRHYVIIDEAAMFLSKTVSELFDQARKFGIGVILAVQRPGQLAPDDVRDAVFGNVGTLLTFRIHEPEEAKLVLRQLGGSSLDTVDLQHLPRFEAYARMHRDGERIDPAWLRAPSPIAPDRSSKRQLQTLVDNARALYARPRADVEEELRAREHLLHHDVEPEIRAVPTWAALPSYAA